MRGRGRGGKIASEHLQILQMSIALQNPDAHGSTAGQDLHYHPQKPIIPEGSSQNVTHIHGDPPPKQAVLSLAARRSGLAMGFPSARLSSDLPESSTCTLPETGLPLHLNLIQRHGNRNVHCPPNIFYYFF